MKVHIVASIPPEELRKILYGIYGLIQSPKYKDINASNNIGQYNIDRRFVQAFEKLDRISEPQILFRADINAKKTKDAWEDFDRHFDGNPSFPQKRQYGEIIKSTLRLLEYIRSYSRTSSNQPTNPIRTVDVGTEKSRLESIKETRNKVKEEIARLKGASSTDEKQVQQLEEYLAGLTKEYKDIQKTIDETHSDKVAEESIQQRIDLAFRDLASYTECLEEERQRLKWEYWGFLLSVPILCVTFFCFYIIFLRYYLANRFFFYDWLGFLPFTIMVPVIATLLWVCIHQKNCANKISIELSDQLFNIHYLEGLLKMTNTLSKDSDMALNRISDTIDTMLENYQSQIGRTRLVESDISKIEMKELESNPYWKLLQELKGLIQSIKK